MYLQIGTLSLLDYNYIWYVVHFLDYPKIF